MVLKKDIENVLNQNIIVYWWNMGKKTLDFRGTYYGFIKDKDIKLKSIRNGLRLIVRLSQRTFIIEAKNIRTVYDLRRALDDAIGIYLTNLGDKSLFIDGHGNQHTYNW
jgi:hypothetical protein